MCLLVLLKGTKTISLEAAITQRAGSKTVCQNRSLRKDEAAADYEWWLVAVSVPSATA